MSEPRIIVDTKDYFVIDKPPQMATEPPSHMPTLRDWLIKQGHINPSDWDEEDRYGVVHRLDTDTSGVILWAKNKEAQERLRSLWQGRAVKKSYLALVKGKISKSGSIEYPIMRDNKKDRQKVVVFPDPKARAAITKYERLSEATLGGSIVSLVRAHPITGRTHQIRVHLKSIGNPIIGDSLYGDKDSKKIANSINVIRQFLHAETLEVGNKTYKTGLPKVLTDSLELANLAFDNDHDIR